jgi:hypothetical protein
MANNSIEVMFPADPTTEAAGRIVQGSLYIPQEKTMQGDPLVVKTGPNKGQPTKKYFFALALKKTQQHWANESWGKPIWAFGHAAWPQGQAQSPGFAWKIEDGDSQIPNKNGRKNCDREGFPGHWIVNFSSSFAPKIFTSNGDPILEPNAVKVGYYVIVRASTQSNENTTNPGIYMNHGMVGFIAYGPEISQGPNPKDIFKGGYVVPPGASTVPIGGAALPASAPTPGGALPPPPGAPVPPAGAPPAAPASTSVVPSAPFLAPPAPGAAPAPAAAPALPPAPGAPPPPATAAPAGPQMTAAANGVSYAAYIAAGWTDAQLRAKGLLQ